MRRGSWALVGIAVGIGSALLCVPALAHHSFGAIYLESDSIEVEGRIVEFQYVNPHAWVHVMGTEGAFGQEKIYSAEWVSTSQLEREGITKTFLKEGDRVRIWGSPAKAPNDNRMHLKRMERSDGWQWRPRRAAPADPPAAR
jgi:hypothetical protein